jgi:hypothetical protein
VAHMPEWFAKTPEMMAMDRYFTPMKGGRVDEAELVDRLQQALADLYARNDFYEDSKALDREARPIKRPSIDRHFKRDWLNAADPFSAVSGGDFWPDLPSRTVVEGLRFGMEIAIKRALGRANLSLSTREASDLFDWYDSVGIDTQGVRPLITSWNCVAPVGSKFFDTQALRGPTVVEWAIATPAPIRYSRDRMIVWELRENTYKGETS